jgi:hypothetical protein
MNSNHSQSARSQQQQELKNNSKFFKLAKFVAIQQQNMGSTE